MYVISLLLIAITFNACGGGGGGNKTSSTVNTDTTNGFTATAENKIYNGQMEFAFGQTATFKAEDITDASWSSNEGSIDASGQYYTPNDLSEITLDTISMNSSSATNSRDITLTLFPTLEDNYFKYNDGNQRFAIKNLTSSQAICVATFQNESISSNEGNLKIKNITATTNKKELSKNKKLDDLLKKNKNYRSIKNSKKNNYNAKTFKKNRKLNRSPKANRASDPIGTREIFFNYFSEIPDYTSYEKLYSGAKCLIYCQIDPETDLPFITKETAQSLGDAFEIANPYHPSQKPIFDEVVRVFGNPWGINAEGVKINDGGIDGEEQIILLIYDGDPSIGGVFYSLDEEPAGTEIPETGEISNGAEIINLNQKFAEDPITLLTILAHEFQHLCNFNQKFLLNGEGRTDEPPENFNEARLYLFDEGLSGLAEDLNGFSFEMPNNKGNDGLFIHSNMYLATISTASPHFISWASDGDYGKGYLFWRYIYDTYGEEAIIAATQSIKIPPEDIEEATGKKFDVLMQEFILAIIQSDTDQPINSKIKISTIDRSKEYFDSIGESLGNFLPIDYIEGFPNNNIKDENPFEIRLYKLLPLNNEVRFTIENIKPQSSYSISTAIITK